VEAVQLAEFFETAFVFVGIPVGFLVTFGLLDRVFGERAAKVIIWIGAIVTVTKGAAVWYKNPRHPSVPEAILLLAFKLAAVCAIATASFIAVAGVVLLVGRAFGDRAMKAVIWAGGIVIAGATIWTHPDIVAAGLTILAGH
jgi:uncharacterized PurR-regulated membrane protein YhhQ (DUF165 family)